MSEQVQKKETKIGTIYTNFARWQSVIDYMGPIMDLYCDDDVSEIMVNKFDHILVQTTQGQRLTKATFGTPENLERFIMQIAGALGQKFTVSSPKLDARFPDDTRLCCLHSSISPKGTNITMRVARNGGGVITSEKMIDNGYMSFEMWHYIFESYQDGKNILFSGNTGSGKTSMMRNVLAELPDQERILIVEDTNEISLDHVNVLNMEAADKLEFSMTMAELIQTTLRQYGSKLVVGEIRDAEAANAFIQAINTGVEGCIASVHANGCRAALSRIQYLLCTLGYVQYELAGQLVLSSIDIFVHCHRSTKYGRRITEVAKVNKDKSGLETVYFFNQDTLRHYDVSSSLDVNESISKNMTLVK
jgi:pilus assembly protein CpaF